MTLIDENPEQRPRPQRSLSLVDGLSFPESGHAVLSVSFSEQPIQGGSDDRILPKASRAVSMPPMKSSRALLSLMSSSQQRLENSKSEAFTTTTEQMTSTLDRSVLFAHDEDDNESNNEQELEEKGEQAPEPNSEESLKEDEPLLVDQGDATLYQVVDAWAQSSTIHGVNIVTKREQWRCWKRALWGFLAFFSLVLLILQVRALVLEYKQYEVVTVTQTIVPESMKMEFPAVTVCNANKYLAPAQLQYNITEPTNLEEYLLITGELEDLLNMTFFNEEDWSSIQPDVWKPSITAFGRCFTFETNRTVALPAWQGGLYFQANLRQDTYGHDHPTAGLYVFVTQPGTDINDQTPYVTVKPGHSFLSIEKTVFDREREKPWSSCKGEAPEYSNARCWDDCANAHVRRTCHCKFPYDEPEQADLPFCTMADWTTGACWEMVLSSHEDSFGTHCSHCTVPPCYEEQYRVTVHELAHADTFVYYTMPFIYGVDSDLYTSNFVGVHVNYPWLRYDHFTESKAVTFAQLLGTVGGSMGLYLGISGLSVFEVFGDLMLLRLVPRLFGFRGLYGLGAQEST